jgi:hypothetical protein
MNKLFKINELQNENNDLKAKLNEIEEMCSQCATKMNANLVLLQEEVVKSDRSNDNSVLLAIANLKKVYYSCNNKNK